MTPREALLAAARVCRDRADACGTSPAERIAHHEGMACADAILALAEQQPAEPALPGPLFTDERGEWMNHETGEVRALPGPWSVEPHGNGWALYLGRDREHHGARICNLTDGMPTDYERIAYALNFAAKQPGPETVSVPREPTEAMIDAPRQIILYAETRGRTLQGLREHLDLAGVEFHSWFPEWAITERGHLTKGAIADLIYRAMLAAGSAK